MYTELHFKLDEQTIVFHAHEILWLTLETMLSGAELHRMLKKNQHSDAENSSVFERFYALAA